MKELRDVLGNYIPTYEEMVAALKAKPKTKDVVEKYHLSDEDFERLRTARYDSPLSQFDMKVLHELFWAPDRVSGEFNLGGALKKCDKCNTFYVPEHVWVLDQNGKNVDKELRCPHCYPDDKETQGAVDGVVAVFKEMHVPPKNIYNTFKNFMQDEAGTLDAYQKAFEFVKNEDTALVFVGSTGVGKTHLAISALHEHMSRGGSGKYIKESELVRQLASTKNFRATKSISELHREFAEDYTMLVLDEIGQYRMSDQDLSEIVDILDDRISNPEMKTIIISNLDWNEFKEKLGDRIISRIVGYGCAVQLVGRDRRRDK
jgi:DNA replication protein